MKYKQIKAAAHNFAHQFLSGYVDNGFIVDHLSSAAAASGVAELRVDLLTGHAEPPDFLSPPLRHRLERHLPLFPGRLKAHNVVPERIHAAEMHIRFFLPSCDGPAAENARAPFECVVQVTDDRGIVHTGTVRDGDPVRDRKAAASPLHQPRSILAQIQALHAPSSFAPGEQDTDEAQIARARRLFQLQRDARWRVAQSSAAERIARLRRLRTAILKHRQALYDGVWADFRKSAPEFEITEIQIVLGEIAHTIRHLRRWMRPRRVPSPPLLKGTAGRVRSEARGQVLVLAPWNYPFQLLVGPLVAAVAAGNVVILRPSEKVPATAAAIARIIADAFPEDEVAMVTGGVQAADALLELPWDHIFFTGSTAVGRKVMRAAAEHLASVTLELGGKSPAIVDRSANVAQAAERIVWGKMVNAGQTCVAPDYVLVHEADAPAFLAAARDTIARFYGTGQAARMSGDFARIVDRPAYDRLVRAMEETVAAGATVEAGGETDPEERYIAPTVLSGVREGMPIMREEIFGPILPVLTVRSMDEALAFVRARPKPLALYLFSRDRAVTERVLGGTTAGGTIVNHVICHLANPDLPFGGVGESGQGSYHGHHGFRAFSHERAVLHAGRWSLAPLYYPPYGPRMRRIANLMSRWMERW
jgi:aldehyde dehydrogenase (NAD+)